MTTPKIRYISLLFLFVAATFWWACSLDRIDPTVKYDPCLGKVKAIFTHNKVGISCDSPCIVQFSNTSTGAKSYSWDFKDGTSSTEKEPNHIFKKTTDVVLTATGENGCQNEATVTVTVSSTCVKPVSDFTFADNQSVGTSIKLTNNSTNADNRFEWYVVDGVDTVFRNTTDISPQFTFTIAATYQVTLIAKNSCGTKSIMKPLTVKTITFQKILPSGINLSSISHDVGNCVKLAINGSGEYDIFGNYNFIGRSMAPEFYFLTVDKMGTLISESHFNDGFGSSSFGNALVEERRQPGGYFTTVCGTLGGTAFAKFLPTRATSGGIAVGSNLTGTTEANCIELTPQGAGNYVICGTKTSNQIYLAKLGDAPFPESKRWAVNIPGTAYCVKNTKDNGFIACGVSNNNFYLIKTDANLNTSWNNAYPTTGSSVAKSVLQNSRTGEYVACGTIDNADIYVLTVNTSGIAVPSKTKRLKSADLSIGGKVLNGSILANCIKETYDGNFIIAGYTTSSNITAQALLIKMNATLDRVLWVKNYGINYGEANFVEETPDGGYIFTGKTTTNLTNSGQANVLLVKTDRDGNVQ